MDPVPEQLSVHLRKKYPEGIYKAVYEAGFSGFWAQRKLSKLGVNCIVVSPGDVPTSNKERKAKTDKRDARKLSKELQSERLEAINIPTIEEEELQMLSRQRQAFVKDGTRSKNRIRALANFMGLELSIDNWSGKTLSLLYEQADNLAGGLELKLHIEALRNCKNLVARSTANLKSKLIELKKMEEIQILKSVPGIGNIAAYTLISEIGNVSRFKGFDQLASWVGLVPTMSDSGEKHSSGEMSRRGNRNLNYILIEAAWIAVRKDPAMLMAFQQLCGRMKKSMAIVRIAKKLLSRIYCVWKNLIPYRANTVSVQNIKQSKHSEKTKINIATDENIAELLKKIYHKKDQLSSKELQKHKAQCLDVLYRKLAANHQKENIKSKEVIAL
jgi:transposase